jgi:uncharacterized SAM-binding protein YcdF (DUF218 family)
MVQAVSLAREYKNFLILYTNGSSALQDNHGTSEKKDHQSAQFFIGAGVAESRLIFERKASNTLENAIFSVQLIGLDIKKPWLLLTSAAHMSRAMAIFNATGWNVTAYPVDYKTSPDISLWSFSLIEGAVLWQGLMYEMLAWVKYLVVR